MAKQQVGQLTLDDLDYDIVHALSQQPELTHKGLAQQLGIPESTCTFRLRRLRDSGIIGPRQLQVDHARLGYPLKAIVLVFLTRHSREIVEEFRRHMVAQPHVLSVMNLTGRYDFMVTVAVKDPEQLRTFVLDHVTTLTSVRGTETHIVFSVQDGQWLPGQE